MNLLAGAPEGVERALAGVDALLVDPQQLHRAHEVHCEWDTGQNSEYRRLYQSPRTFAGPADVRRQDDVVHRE